MVTLYSCRLDLSTFEIERSSTDVEDDYPSFECETDADWNGGAGYASVEDGDVYAESLVPQEDADRLVLEKCR